MSPTAPGRLVLVGTPIGNLGDLSPRAVEVLSSADTIFCEDTRRTRALLSVVSIRARGRLVSLHEHNEAARVPAVLSRLVGGELVAMVTDAGMPAISDPGTRVVAAALAADVAVAVVPGPSSVLAALVVSGFSTERFCVEGFLPRKGKDRRDRLEALRSEVRTSVILEAPTRVVATLSDLAAICGDRAVAVARELTKVHEHVWRGTLGTAADALSQDEMRGEVVIVIAGAAPAAPPGHDDIVAAVGERLAQGESPSRAAELVAGDLGVPKREAYDAALALRDQYRVR